MEITRKIVLTYDIKDDKLIFNDLRTLCLAMGTSSVSGNLGVYGVEKKDNKFIVDIKTIKERLEQKKEKMRKMQDYIDVMQQIVNQYDKQKD